MGLYTYDSTPIPKSDRIPKLVENLYAKMPEIESARAVLITESYKQTENEPMIIRRAKAFQHILENIPITIRDLELVVGSSTLAPRGCQTFPEFSYEWLEAEFDTVETRSADPFYISEQTKKELKEANAYWKGRTTSDLATAYMEPETLLDIEHNIFTPGNYFYNGVGHVTVKYGEVLEIGFSGIRKKAEDELASMKVSDGNYQTKSRFLEAVMISCDAAITYARRYAKLALEMAEKCSDPVRKKELLIIAQNCANVPEKGATGFYEACQSFWFVQQLLQIESSGHSISPGRFDQYMYPYYKKDLDSGKITREFAQELLDCIWVKLNDLNKCRDAASAEGFAGYSLFQNLIVGGQNEDGIDVTNDLSFMCITSSMHVFLPMPSLSVRVWNGSPHEFLIYAAELTRTGIGLPAYYNDEVIIPSLESRGLTLQDARDYNIIGCVEPQKSGKTNGWHDAAFFNVAKVFDIAIHGGKNRDGKQLGPVTKPMPEWKSMDDLYEAYETQIQYFVSKLVEADNAVDIAHRERAPLPFMSALVDDCIGRGKTVMEGGAIYNFTGPQAFGNVDTGDAIYCIKKHVFEDKDLTMQQIYDAMEHNFGAELGAGCYDGPFVKLSTDSAEPAAAAMESVSVSSEDSMESIINAVVQKILAEKGSNLSMSVDTKSEACTSCSDAQRAEYDRIRHILDATPCFGNDIDEVDMCARKATQVYSHEVEKYKNPRGGQYQAGCYPVSANVLFGKDVQALPDGRYSNAPLADGVSPRQGHDVKGPTAAGNSVAKLDQLNISNGTLYNQKFLPSAVAGDQGLLNFAAVVRNYFDKKGMHVQFNVIDRETLLDAQAHPENYKDLVVRVAGYSAHWTVLAKEVQDDIIARTEQHF